MTKETPSAQIISLADYLPHGPVQPKEVDAKVIDFLEAKLNRNLKKVAEKEEAQQKKQKEPVKMRDLYKMIQNLQKQILTLSENIKKTKMESWANIGFLIAMKEALKREGLLDESLIDEMWEKHVKKPHEALITAAQGGK